MGKLAVGLSSLVAMLLFASSAVAEVRLDWNAVGGCPDAATVTSTIQQWFESSGTQAGASDVQIDADVKTTAAGYELALKLWTASGERSMRMFSATCDVFAQAIALQASLSSSTERAALVPPPTAAGDPGHRWVLRATGLLGSSPLQAPAFGVGITGAYVLMPLRIELLVGYGFARERYYEAQPEVGGSLQSGFAGARACTAWPLRRVEFSGCGGADLGLARGKGLGVSGTRVTHRTWFALAVGSGLSVILTSAWSVWLGVDLLLSLVRPVFYVAQLGPLSQTDRFGIRAALGIELRMQ